MEIPYILIQAVIITVITYPMVGYDSSAYKVFWYMYTIFCSMLYFNYMGMMLVAITPSYPVAAILQAAFYVQLNLFGGFAVPLPRIPKWWVWFYYLMPTSWSLNGMLTSQYGDVKEKITVFQETKTVAEFLTDYFGYHHDRLPLVGVLLILYPIFFAAVFAYCIKHLNFQRR